MMDVFYHVFKRFFILTFLAVKNVFNVFNVFKFFKTFFASLARIEDEIENGKFEWA